MYPFSYSDCAVRMVCREPRRSLREASCCSVDVVNGDAGLRVYGLVSRLRTAKSAVSSAATSTRAASSSRCTVDRDVRTPRSSKSRPVATRAPSTVVKRAPNTGSPASAVAN